MEFTIESDALKKALQLLNIAIPAKPSHPVLACVCFEIMADSPGILELSGFDLQIGLLIKLDIENGKPGIICIPARLLIEYVEKSQGSLFCKATKDNALRIQAGAGKGEIRGMDGEEFPAFPEEGLEAPIIISAPLLMDGFRASREMASPDQTKQVLTAINFQGREYPEGELLRLAGTDGHKGSKIIMQAEIDMKFPQIEEKKGYALGFDFNIPAPAINLLEKCYKAQPEEYIELILVKDLGDESIFLRIGKYSIFSRLKAGEYPNMDKLFPDNFSYEIEIDKKELIKSLSRILAIVNTEKRKFIDLILDMGNQKIILQSKDCLAGSGQDSIDCAIKAPPDSQELKLLINPEYLLDCLNILIGAEVIIKLNGALSPICLEPALCDFDHQIIMMPCQPGKG